MLGGVGKYLLLMLVLLVAWYGYKYVTRIGAVRQDEARRRTPRPGSKPGALAAEDTVKCAACGAYVTASARSCGRAECPWPP